MWCVGCVVACRAVDFCLFDVGLSFGVELSVRGSDCREKRAQAYIEDFTYDIIEWSTCNTFHASAASTTTNRWFCKRFHCIFLGTTMYESFVGFANAFAFATHLRVF